MHNSKITEAAVQRYSTELSFQKISRNTFMVGYYISNLII